MLTLKRSQGKTKPWQYNKIGKGKVLLFYKTDRTTRLYEAFIALTIACTGYTTEGVDEWREVPEKQVLTGLYARVVCPPSRISPTSRVSPSSPNFKGNSWAR
jgi:hypothetical protein